MWVKTKERSCDSRLVDVSDGVLYKYDENNSYWIYFTKFYESDFDEELGYYDTKEERDQAFDRLTKMLNERDGAIFL